MSENNFKHDLFTQFARVGKAMGNGYRLELLEFLAQGERNVEELSKASGLPIANTSQHLQHLRQAGLITSTKRGLRVFYRLSGDDVIDLLDSLRMVAERHITEVQELIDAYLTVKDDLESIPASELLDRARSGQVTVLDVRPIEEYQLGHLPGAINIPIDDLEKYYNALDNKQQIVAYCRGPHCVLAFEAVEKLRQHGFTAQRLENGFPEWKASGLPVEH